MAANSAPRTFTLIKGVPKSLQIEKLYYGSDGLCHVKFKNSPTTFRYRRHDVLQLSKSAWHDPVHCKVYVDGKELKNIAGIHSFPLGDRRHWRIVFSGGAVKDYRHGDITVAESCLSDSEARNVFEYLKGVAQTNELGKSEEQAGILASMYARIDFVDNKLAAAPYLYPKPNEPKRRKCPPLLFPFGCNGSQEKAVTTAFEQQLSVIQGPPGTGKTQTILNIIANILAQGKTVMVVSNNNSATANVLEKMQKYGIGFIVAPLGSNANKEAFLANQPAIPDELAGWELSEQQRRQKAAAVAATLAKLRSLFALQETLALAKQELKEVELEWQHFKNDNQITDDAYADGNGLPSKRLMRVWLDYQASVECDKSATKSFLGRLRSRLKWRWLRFVLQRRLGIRNADSPDNHHRVTLELQARYYLARRRELQKEIASATAALAQSDAKALNDSLSSLSMEVLKDLLFKKYHKRKRTQFCSTPELRAMPQKVLEQYPVVLSTTFAAKTALSSDVVFDYLIMDEASQVSVETGALAMMCAANAVIVGDSMQLPNVVTAGDRLKLDAVFDKYRVAPGYNSANHSFLSSICAVIPRLPQTLLREHYRCHPKIINFCNQKFYGGNLIIMTEDRGEEHVMAAVRTVPGRHCRGHYNQREIDVVRQEVLPSLPDHSDIGIITPYNDQVDAFNRQFDASPEAATVHKYQGREKDTVIMSVVDDDITEFSDDPNLLNVAVSRAKKHFCIVLSGNEQKLKGNISDLVDYINYNNFSVTDSRLCSIFDYLYGHYTRQRIAYLSNRRRISEYDSENLTYALLSDILAAHRKFAHLGILCHTPLRSVLRDTSLMNDDERRYASNPATHLDFLIVSHVTKKPLLAIETDGYSYHNDSTVQHRRDLMKDRILQCYGLPLLRLSTTGSDERRRIVDALERLVA